jgi:2-dehydropantoate 2-reductase
MKIAVIGAGAIGTVVAGYVARTTPDVVLIGRKAAVEKITREGVRISGVRGEWAVKIRASERLAERPDLAILAVKTQDIEEALSHNLEFLRESLLLTTQNGVQADTIAALFLARERIISSIVMFGATSLEPAKVVHNFEGAWIIGKMFSPNDESVAAVREVLDPVFPVVVTSDLMGMKYLKIFVNANNCIPAILGVSMQEAFSDVAISRISIAIWREGLEVVNHAGIPLVSLPDFPLERLQGLAAMPLEEAARIFSGIMKQLSTEPLYGSVLQSIRRGKPSEIDFLNGEFVALSERQHIQAPLNRKLVEMVHQVERSGSFFSQEALVAETRALIA